MAMAGSSSSVSFGRPTTAASTFSSPGSRPGVKRTLDHLVREVEFHTTELGRLEAAAESKGSSFEDALAAMEARLMAHIDEVRQEMRESFAKTNARVEQLQETIKVQAGEAGVLQEQTKDSHRRIVELSKQLHELNVEIMGED